MRIWIDIPLFSSPTVAFGNVSGEVEVTDLPKEQAAFPWPAEWLAERPTYFTPEQSHIMSVTEISGRHLVILSGIVCSSVADARDCSAYLQRQAGLSLDEYEPSA